MKEAPRGELASPARLTIRAKARFGGLGPTLARAAVAVMVLALAGCAWVHTSGPAAGPSGKVRPRVDASNTPRVGRPPETILAKVREADREAARQFYAKHVDAQGLPILASGEVSDEALVRTHELVTRALAGRRDVLEAMVAQGMYLIVIGKDQLYTDMPEYRNSPNPRYLNERVRGTGGLPTSFGEENLLSLPIDRYDDESIALHEFCHTIDGTLSRLDGEWARRLDRLFRDAMSKGLWKNTYSASNPAEYWAEGVTMYFDCDRPNNWNHGPVRTREQLKRYDPGLHDLVRQTLRLAPAQDWRYRWRQTLPNVIPPPARFKIDPYYTKFTYAREFPVLGSKQASDEALLQANDTIRKMFAYRHDLLKALIDDGARLVVLGREERLSDLPEFKAAREQGGFDQVRYLDYAPEQKLMVVPEENVLGLPREPFAGECMVVSVFAKAIHQVAGLRPPDPAFENQRQKQQYELRVRRLDAEFDRRLERLYDEAMSQRLWLGTAAARNRGEYWAAGVEAYFDAAGEGQPPAGADRPVVSRELLRAYDPKLYELVDETMAYRERVDWRFRPPTPGPARTLSLPSLTLP